MQRTMDEYPSIETKAHKKTLRCVNLDWLEVHCRAAVGELRDAQYYIQKGYDVDIRPYGTRVYREMFTIKDAFGQGLLEIRRDPASFGLNGIHDWNECHIRLKNRSCYFDNAALFLSDFLEKEGYYDIRISRVDICLDFERFDEGDDPQKFIERYFKRKYSKINQGRISSHGEDTWNGQVWNSLSWGAKTSDVTTKLYNKTLELYDVKHGSFNKPYIREAWLRCGLIDDLINVTRDGQRVQVWRLEFSLKSPKINWLTILLDGKAKAFQSLKNNLQTYSTRPRILVMFAALAQHYFRFKYFEDGQRKDRCKDKVLFDFTGLQGFYLIGKNSEALSEEVEPKSKLQRLIMALQEYLIFEKQPDINKLTQKLITHMQTSELKGQLPRPWSHDDLEEMRLLIKYGTRYKGLAYDKLLEYVRKELEIRKEVVSFENKAAESKDAVTT